MDGREKNDTDNKGCAHFQMSFVMFLYCLCKTSHIIK